MSATLLAGLLLAALPAGSARYRAELAGVAVGVAELRISCGESTCEVRWGTRMRQPAEAGGGIAEAGVVVEVDRDGRWRGGALKVRRGGASARPEGVPDAVPSAVLEVVLAREVATRAERCVPFFDEEHPALRRACGHRVDGTVHADVGGVAVRVLPGSGAFPSEVDVGGRFRWVLDPEAKVPPGAPRLAGMHVPGPADPARARTFCGVPVDPPADAAFAATLPPPRADGESCREKTAQWLAATRLLGFEGRTAVGVAWDGQAFVWHAWVEVRRGATWIPIDPSFEQRPARGPRFTVARYARGDHGARDAAGARILECWGSARVE